MPSFSLPINPRQQNASIRQLCPGLFGVASPVASNRFTSHRIVFLPRRSLRPPIAGLVSASIRCCMHPDAFVLFPSKRQKRHTSNGLLANDPILFTLVLTVFHKEQRSNSTARIAPQYTSFVHKDTALRLSKHAGLQLLVDSGCCRPGLSGPGPEQQQQQQAKFFLVQRRQ